MTNGIAFATSQLSSHEWMSKERIDTADSSSKYLKRKRPARIDITKLHDVSLDAKIDVGISVVEEDGEMFSVYCRRGKRRHQLEDRYMKAGDEELALFGVLDGHGGAGVAEAIAGNLDRYLMNELSKIGGDDETGIKEAVRSAYEKMDSHLLRDDVPGGACGVTALIRGDDLVVSNTGDCRAVLSRGGAAEAVTSDHKLDREDERKRIERLGGYVDCFNGVWRLHGALAVSRGFGDALLKEYMTVEPETKVIKLHPEHEFLILASDGLWDKVCNQEAVDIARPMCVGNAAGSVLSACRRLAELSISRGSADDVTVMIVLLLKVWRGSVSSTVLEHCEL